jgi:hypothetical protein
MMARIVCGICGDEEGVSRRTRIISAPLKPKGADVSICEYRSPTNAITSSATSRILSYHHKQLRATMTIEEFFAERDRRFEQVFHAEKRA